MRNQKEIAKLQASQNQSWSTGMKVLQSIRETVRAEHNGNGYKANRSGYEIWAQMGFSPICELGPAIEAYKRRFVARLMEGKRWMQKVRTPEECAIRFPHSMQPRRHNTVVQPEQEVKPVVQPTKTFQPLVRVQAVQVARKLNPDALVVRFADNRIA